MTGIVAAAAAACSGSVSVSLENQTVANDVSFSTASAGVQVGRNGKLYTGYSNTLTTPDYQDVGGVQWASREAASIGDGFECRLDTTTGTLSSGTADSWLAVTSDRPFAVYQVGVGTKVFTGTLRIRRGAVELDSCAVSLTATVIS